MLLASIITIILFGIFLIVLEILILPGLIAGIIGAIFMITGIVMMYNNFGSTYGHITLISSISLTGFIVFYFLKSKSWQRFGLKDTIDSKVIDLSQTDIKPGMSAITLSALRPMGIVLINNEKYEAQTNGAYIEANTNVVVLKVMSNKLLVSLP